MRRSFLILAALYAMSASAFAQVCNDEGRYFHLAPPGYTVSSSRRHAIHRMAKGIRWYKEHQGDKPLETIDGKCNP